jgi:hypothetical protein
MPSTPPFHRRAAVAALALLLATGCAATHSDQRISLVKTEESAPSVARLTNVDIVVVARPVGEAKAGSLETIANRQLATLLPALSQQLPVILRRNGVPAHAVPDDRSGGAFDIVTIQPLRASELSSHGASRISGNVLYDANRLSNGDDVGVTMAIEIRHRSGGLVWRGTALERASLARPDSIEWGDAMAQDLARTLLIRLREDGLVRLGPTGDDDPV